MYQVPKPTLTALLLYECPLIPRHSQINIVKNVYMPVKSATAKKVYIGSRGLRGYVSSQSQHDASEQPQKQNNDKMRVI